jgi:hypothetical protein
VSALIMVFGTMKHLVLERAGRAAPPRAKPIAPAATRPLLAVVWEDLGRADRRRARRLQDPSAGAAGSVAVISPIGDDRAQLAGDRHAAGTLIAVFVVLGYIVLSYSRLLARSSRRSASRTC